MTESRGKILPNPCHGPGRDNIKRIHRRSERRRVSSRPCPDCGTVIRAGWKEHRGFVNEVGPEGDTVWYRFRATCPKGKKGF